jgi:hypothetical protein
MTMPINNVVRFYKWAVSRSPSWVSAANGSALNGYNKFMRQRYEYEVARAVKVRDYDIFSARPEFYNEKVM